MIKTLDTELVAGSGKSSLDDRCRGVFRAAKMALTMLFAVANIAYASLIFDDNHMELKPDSVDSINGASKSHVLIDESGVDAVDTTMYLTKRNVINGFYDVGKQVCPETPWCLMEKSNIKLAELTKNRDERFVFIPWVHNPFPSLVKAYFNNKYHKWGIEYAESRGGDSEGF
jgi:hypothetical protein